jgi:hypothetical protein
VEEPESGYRHSFALNAQETFWWRDDAMGLSHRRSLRWEVLLLLAGAVLTAAAGLLDQASGGALVLSVLIPIGYVILFVLLARFEWRAYVRSRYVQAMRYEYKFARLRDESRRLRLPKDRLPEDQRKATVKGLSPFAQQLFNERRTALRESLRAKSWYTDGA